jgi:hypothetical protein
MLTIKAASTICFCFLLCFIWLISNKDFRSLHFAYPLVTYQKKRICLSPGYLPFTPKGYFLIWSPIIIDCCHSLFRIESTKGSYAKEWSKWEKQLREVLINNAEYLNSIQVKFSCFLYLYNLIYSVKFNANGVFWKQLEQKIIVINR